MPEARRCSWPSIEGPGPRRPRASGTGDALAGRAAPSSGRILLIGVRVKRRDDHAKQGAKLGERRLADAVGETPADPPEVDLVGEEEPCVRRQRTLTRGDPEPRADPFVPNGRDLGEVGVEPFQAREHSGLELATSLRWPLRTNTQFALD